MSLPKPPLPVQFALSFLVAAVLILALVIFVDNNQNDPNENKINPSARAEANREADIVVTQDQAPHVAMIRRGESATAAASSAVRAYMQHQMALGTVAGSLQRVTCTPAGGSRLRCSAYAADVRYPFFVVADPARHQVVYCKKDAAPVAGEDIPLSPRCLWRRRSHVSPAALRA